MSLRCTTCLRESSSLLGGHTCDDCFNTSPLPASPCQCEPHSVARSEGHCQRASLEFLEKAKKAQDLSEPTGVLLNLLPKLQPTFSAPLGEVRGPLDLEE